MNYMLLPKTQISDIRHCFLFCEFLAPISEPENNAFQWKEGASWIDQNFPSCEYRKVNKIKAVGWRTNEKKIVIQISNNIYIFKAERGKSVSRGNFFKNGDGIGQEGRRDKT